MFTCTSFLKVYYYFIRILNLDKCFCVFFHQRQCISLIVDDFYYLFISLLAFEASSSINGLLISYYNIPNGAAVSC